MLFFGEDNRFFIFSIIQIEKDLKYFTFNFIIELFRFHFVYLIMGNQFDDLKVPE